MYKYIPISAEKSSIPMPFTHENAAFINSLLYEHIVATRVST